MHGSLNWVNSQEFGLINLDKMDPERAEELAGIAPHLIFGTDVKLTGEQPFFSMAHLLYEKLSRADIFVVMDDCLRSGERLCVHTSSQVNNLSTLLGQDLFERIDDGVSNARVFVACLSRLLFSPPSSKYVTESVLPPAMLKFPAAPESPLVSVTPGCSSARFRTFLPLRGAC